MEETRYMISDAAKRIDVEPHVLRYWEEELEMEIPRNEMGHRYYRDEDIETMRAVKRLKDQGFQLKAIKMLLPDIRRVEQLEPGKLLSLKEQLELVMGITPSETSDAEAAAASEENSEDGAGQQEEYGVALTPEDRMIQFREIMNDIVTGALAGNNGRLAKAVSDSVTNRVIKEMDYLMRLKEDKEEERYKQLDRTIREYQEGKRMTAAARERKKRLFFWKKHTEGYPG
ncbi:MAG TPA: MerR family transcriptional regulator [Candidatus Caccomorpha excrementavium]|nr:MerR family transcriptional regulator [Candidatus Caccomorpha excrementavium]